MERMYNRKILNACESLLFGNTKITFRNFIKKCDKQGVKILGATSERIVAFLKLLPKNYALFQALEQTFIYILQEQFPMPEEDQDVVYIKLLVLEYKRRKRFIFRGLCEKIL